MNPALASCIANSRPIPSDAPVTTNGEQARHATYSQSNRFVRIGRGAKKDGVEWKTGFYQLLTCPRALLGSELLKLSMGRLWMVDEHGHEESLVCVTHTNSGAQKCVVCKRKDAGEGDSGRKGTENLQPQCEMGDRIHCVRVVLISEEETRKWTYDELGGSRGGT